MIEKTDKRKRLWIILLILNLAVIWGNSLLPGELSGNFSRWVKSILDALLPGTGKDPEAGHGLLRKFGHFFEFCCLGICLSVLIRMQKENQWQQLLLPLLLGGSAACIDETIQIFVPDRGPGIRDVGIDTMGVATGILILTFALHLRKRKNKGVL